MHVIKNKLFLSVNALFAIIYLLSALVQYNDQDGLLWAVFYLLAMVVCISVYFPARAAKPVYSLLFLYGLTTILSLLVAVYSWGQIDSAFVGEGLFERSGMNFSGVEAAREAGGALLVFIWVSLLFITEYRSRG